MKIRFSSIALSATLLVLGCVSEPAHAALDEVSSLLEIADGIGGLPSSTLVDFDNFGYSCTAVGDVNGDGVVDVAVGAQNDDSGGNNRGAVYILFLNTDGTVKGTSKIADGVGGLPADTLSDRDNFGYACASLDDLDGDGIQELLVGAPLSVKGDLFVLFLNSSGTVKSFVQIGDGAGGLPAMTLVDFDGFGTSCVSLGNLDGMGGPEIAVGSPGDDTTGTSRGAVYILSLKADGTVESSSKIANGVGGLPDDLFSDIDIWGQSCAAPGDIDGDEIPDLVIATGYEDTGGQDRGAALVLFLNADGTVKSYQKIADGVGGLPASTLSNGDSFGRSCTAIGDIDGDEVPDLLVGANEDDTGGLNLGACYVLLLNADGTVKSSSRIADGLGGIEAGTFPVDGQEFFGSSCTLLGDLDKNGVPTIAVGASGNDTAGPQRGGIYLLELGDPPPDNSALKKKLRKRIQSLKKKLRVAKRKKKTAQVKRLKKQIRRLQVRLRRL